MKRIFTDKKIRYGTFSTVIAIVFIALLIVINLVIGELDHKFDLTSAETYSISDKSEAVLDSLNENITIYTLFKTGKSDSIVNRVQKVLDQYDKNPHITVENRDLYLYPDFAKQYASENKSVAVNSLIVTNGSRYKIINYEEYYSGSGDMNVESCVTSAINYVGLESAPIVYVITGHGEISYAAFSGFVKQAELAGYEFKELNLLESDIPEDCGVLLMTTCYRDYSDDEVQKIKDYLTNDGRLLFVASDIKKKDHPKMLSVISGYGVELGESYVMEGNAANYMMYPFEIFPVLKEHAVNSSLRESGYKVLAYGGYNIKTLDLKKQGLEIEQVLASTDASYIKAEGNKSPNPEEGDEKGPFTIAAAITDSSYTDTAHATKIIVIGCFYMLDASIDEMVNGGNSSFLVNSMNWLNDSENSVYIKPKSLVGEKIVIDDGTANTIKLFAWGIIPGALFIAGFVVWIRRRNG